MPENRESCVPQIAELEGLRELAANAERAGVDLGTLFECPRCGAAFLKGTGAAHGGVLHCPPCSRVVLDEYRDLVKRLKGLAEKFLQEIGRGPE